MTALQDVPLFPLGTVLFPGGGLPLKIFEQRYMDMAKECLRSEVPFGVCLIASGRETGAPALPHDTGTLARIDTWDMPQLGVLHVHCRGEQRFRILSRRIERSGLLRAEIELFDESPTIPMAAEHAFLAELLSRVFDNIEDKTRFEPLRLDDATWVSYRLCELLPLSLADKQRALELTDTERRLDIVQQFLHDAGLLKQMQR